MAITEPNSPETYTLAALHRLTQVIDSVTEVPLIPTVASFSALALAFSAFYLMLSTLGGNLASLIRRARRSRQEDRQSLSNPAGLFSKRPTVSDGICIVTEPPF